MTPSDYPHAEAHQLEETEEPWLPCKARARARNYLLLTIVLFWLCAIAVYCAATGDRP